MSVVTSHEPEHAVVECQPPKAMKDSVETRLKRLEHAVFATKASPTDYVSILEQTVLRLKEENARLREKIGKICDTAYAIKKSEDGKSDPFDPF